MSYKQSLFDLIDKGREGGNIGLDIGLPKLESYMDGLLPGTSYLVGGASGSGKSTFALYCFIYKPIMQVLNGEYADRDPRFILFNLEMTGEQIYAKLLSMYIYDTYGEQIKFKEMFSRGKDCILSDEHYELIKKCDHFIDVLDERLTFHNGSLNAEGFKSTIIKDLGKYGSFKDGKYFPKNPNQIVGMLIDHMSSNWACLLEIINIIIGLNQRTSNFDHLF